MTTLTPPSPATVRAYRGRWRTFEQWCRDRDVSALPATLHAVASFLRHRSQAKALSTLSVDMAAVSWHHRLTGAPDPCRSPEVLAVMRALRAEKGAGQARKDAADVGTLRVMVATLDPDRLIDQRDRALLLLGFASALRRSELAALLVSDVERLGLPYGSDPDTCPVRALRAWLAASGITEGPIFRPVNRHGHLGASALSGWAVGEVVKRCAEAAGLDPGRFGGHSLRAGLITSAAEAGVHPTEIAAHARMRRAASVVGNIRPDVGRPSVSAMVGL